jgi:hypothetical protein
MEFQDADIAKYCTPASASFLSSKPASLTMLKVVFDSPYLHDGTRHKIVFACLKFAGLTANALVGGETTTVSRNMLRN